MSKRYPFSARNEAPAPAAGAAPAAPAAAPAEGATPATPAGAQNSLALPGGIDPASVMVIDRRTNQVLIPAGGGLPPNTYPSAQNVALPNGLTVSAVNASSAMSLVPETRLTAFAVGYPTDAIEEASNFRAPGVPAALSFKYRVRAKGNAYGTVDNDIIGIGGMPGLVTFDDDSLVAGVLQSRGLECQMDVQEEAAFNATPGWSAEMEWTDRLAQVLDFQRRGRFQRILALAAATTGAATGKTWNAAADPIGDLRTEVNIIAKLVGGAQNVRVEIGSDAWEILVNHAKIAGGTNYARIPLTIALLATYIGVPAENIRLNYLQVVATKQGVTTTTTDLLTPAEIWLFACSQNPNRNDPSFMKTFFMNFNGAGTYVYTYNPHPLVVRKGNARYEAVKVTNSTAVKRLSIAAS